MKYEISDREITMLNVLKNFMLLSSLGQIFVIKDFKIEEAVEKKFFSGDKQVKYVTYLKIYTYNFQGKFLGVLEENSCEHALLRYDFYVMRQQWLDFEDQLKSFGFKVVKIETEPTENKQ